MAYTDIEARRACHKRYYERNKERYIVNAKRTRSRLKVLLHESKDVPCMDCGQKFPPCVMDFDHRDPDTKLFNVSQMMTGGSIVRMRAEIAKCDVVCANCHRIRTHLLRVV